ncbi:MAG: apolipoprotein A1/A4/E family protein [Clostridia bacterium]|nr:apolipoprotein A1/A4/E family protein [Clostridia bacterium]
MKKVLAFLMVLSLLSAACLGFAEEEEQSWKERLTTAVDDLWKDIREAGQEAADVIGEKAEQVSETVSDALSDVGEKLEELSEQTSGILENAKGTVTEYAEQVKDTAGEKLDKLSEQVSDVAATLPGYAELIMDTAAENLDKLSDQASDVLANTRDALADYAKTTTEKLNKLSDQVSGILTITKLVTSYYVDQAKEDVAQKADELSENISKAAKTAQTSLLKALSSAQTAAVNKLQELVNLLKGGTNTETPAVPQNVVISGSEETPARETPTQPAFFPVPGYGFYFGMTWAEARAFNVNYLNDSRANAYKMARALVMLNQQNSSLYFLWFAGETDSAYLFEVDEFAFSSQDTLIPPQDANGQYNFNTTEATVKQVYTEKASYCGQRFGSASNLESGLLVPSLMFGENEAGISQTQVYIKEDTDGVIVVSHFVYTADCGVNVIIYQHMGNSAE